jgi:hypothetical protein
MKAFLDHQIDIEKIGSQLNELQGLLESKTELSEKHDLSPFFKGRPNLISFVGYLHPGITKSDKFAYEYDIFGDFSSDFTVGDSRRNSYCFIELEDAREKSIFRNTGRATPDWSPRFEHGYSQIIDWSYKLDDMEKSDTFEERFGARSIDSFSILIIGRSQFLSAQDERRLRWRERHVVVRSQQIRCLTYDELLTELKEIFSIYSLAYAAEEEVIDVEDQ